MAFAPDGATLATGGRDGTVRVWDAQTGTELRQLTGHTDAVTAVAFAPGGASLATTSGDGTARIWDARTGTELRQLTGHTDRVTAAAFAPDGATLATASGDGTARIWDMRTGTELRQLSSGGGQVFRVAFAPDGATVATASSDRAVRIWDARTGTELHQISSGGGAVMSVAFAPDGATLATASSEGAVRIWDARTGAHRRRLTGHRGYVLSVAFAADGAVLAGGGQDGAVRVWDARTGTELRQLTGHTGTVTAVAFAPGGATLATGSHDGTARIWDARTGTELHQLTGHTGPVFAVAFAPDGTALATGGDDGTARIWDARTGTELHQLTGHTDSVGSVAFAPGGATLATASSDGTARIWDARTGARLRQLTGHTGRVNGIAFAPDGATLATASSDRTARIWDARTGTERRQLTGHSRTFFAVAFAPDGTALATGGDDGTARIWDARTGTELHQLTGHRDWVQSVVISPDGAALATAGNDGTIRIWDARTGTELRQLTGHTGPVNAVAFAPDGATLATAGNDGTARIWDARTGTELRQLTGHISRVSAVAFAPDGATLATSGNDGTIRIWNPRNGQQVDGTDFGVSRPVGRLLAGVRSDAPSALDQIAATTDVETLSDLIAASETAAPLAIAVIGDWGAGKSSVLIQVQQRIDRLAELSRNNPGLSVFAENVRQVRFNAWDYSDDHVWSGLVDHLFAALAADPAGTDPATRPAKARDDPAALRQQIQAREKERQHLADRLPPADGGREPGGFLGWLGSPAEAGRVLLVSAGMLGRDIRRHPGTLLLWAVLGGAAYGAWRLWGPRIGTVAIAMAPIVAIGQQLLTWHRRGTSAAGSMRARLGERQQKITRELTGLRERLALVDAAEGLKVFLTDRAEPGSYQRYRGLLGEVRADLTRLAGKLAAAREEWAASGAVGPAPLERIVLYIDDLDRCPPPRVVEVLEAVHLMLALDLFVVVVAVDARWLIRSMEYHYQELFGPDRKPGTAEPAGQGTSPDPASPVDYLDKIFQIPYVLAPPPPDAVAAYLRSLLPVPAATLPAATAAVTSAEAGSAEEIRTVPVAAAAESQVAATPAGPADSPEPDMTDRDTGRDGQDARITDSEDLKDLAGPRADGPESAAQALPDLRPRGLQVSQPEADFLALLGPLLPTPRAAKRLVNLYRLVRISIPEAELTEFAGAGGGAPYQVVQVLLAILVGSPAAAVRVFREITDAPADGDIKTVLDKLGTAGGAENRIYAAISAVVERLAQNTALVTETSAYQQWCPRLARYSFHTRELAAGLSGVATGK